MDSSWRITTNTLDLSNITAADQGEIGAMVIFAAKGSKEPVFFDRGQENRLITYFGEPTSDYPEILEAIEYNKSAPIWVASPPSTADTLGAVLVSNTGSAGIPAGITLASWDAGYTFATTDNYFVLAAKSPYADDLGVKVSYNTNTELFTMDLYKNDPVLNSYRAINTYKFSLVQDKKNASGVNVFIDSVLGENDYINYQINTANSTTNPAGYTLNTTTPFTNDSSTVAFDGGSRSIPTDSGEKLALLNQSWEYFQSKSAYPAKIFMDGSGVSGISSTFNTLRNTYQIYSHYIIMLPSSLDAASAVTLKEQSGLDQAGMSWFWNRGQVRNSYKQSTAWVSLIGRIGRKFASMKDVFDGLAPSYIDENGHGGQLGTDILKLEYEPTDAQQAAFDAIGINPLIQDRVFGVMVAGQRTCQNPNRESDTSWIAHSRLFDYIKSSVISNALTYQLTKLNDTTHRFQVQTRVEDILRPILSAQILTDAKVVCDTKNNPPEILAQRKFVLSVAVKVTPFAEFIEFNFIHAGQTVDVQTLI